jgi:hypothetical protein
MKIDRNWLKRHNACAEVIARFVEWAGKTPRSLEEIAEHHPNSFDLAWIIDRVAPFDIRMDITCRIAGEAAWMFSQQPKLYRHGLRFACKINPGNIKEAKADARQLIALTLVDLYDDAAKGCVADTLDSWFEISSEQPDIDLRTALRVIEHAQTCPVERPLSPEERSAAAERVGKAYLTDDEVFWIQRQTEEGLYEVWQQFIIRCISSWNEYGWVPCEYLMHPDEFAGAMPFTAPQPGEEITVYRPLLGDTVSCLVGE